MLASLGDFAFEVSAQNIMTFTDLTFQNSVQYQEHKIITRKGLLEFTGLNASTCSLKIHLDASLTDDIMNVIAYFYEAMNEGNALAFMIGTEVMGEGLWVIERLDENYKRIDNHGGVQEADITLNLKEYLDDV